MNDDTYKMLVTIIDLCQCPILVPYDADADDQKDYAIEALEENRVTIGTMANLIKMEVDNEA